MKKAVLLIIGLLTVALVNAQETTKNDKSNQSWEANATWVDNTAPAYTNVGNSPTNVDFNIYGYTRLGSSSTGRNLTLAGGQPTLTMTIYDTLVIYGNLTAAVDAMTIVVPAGGLLIVFGDLDMQNKVDLSNAGNIVVTGNVTKSGGSGSITVSGGGSFFASSYNNGAQGAQSAIGNGPPDPSRNNTTDLQAALPAVYKFIQANGATPLPIKLTDFSARIKSEQISLDWATESELNFDYFEVERSANAIDFFSIGKVTGHGTSNVRNSYSLIDEKPLIGKNYYRLKSVDFDGYTEYFHVIGVDFSADKNFLISPNPSDGISLGFTMNFNPDENSTIIVFDNLSNIVGVYKPSDANQSIAFTNGLKSGVYYAKLISGDFVKVERFVVR